MTNLSDEDRARLMASKAQHEKELAEVKEAKRIAAEKEQFESFQAGVEWASKVASYSELEDFVVRVRAHRIAGTWSWSSSNLHNQTFQDPSSGSDPIAFQAGAKSVYDQLKQAE